MSSSGVGSNSGTIYYNYYGFSGIQQIDDDDPDGLSAERRAVVDDALAYLGEVLGIDFVATADQGDHVDLFFQDNVFASGGGEAAYANSVVHASGNGETNHYYIDYSWVNITPGFDSPTAGVGDYLYQAVVHEVLHALGLGHSGPYSGQSNFVTDDDDPDHGNHSNIYLNDSYFASIMSYFTVNPGLGLSHNSHIASDHSFDRVITPMAADFEALRHFYGSSAFVGDTVYGFNTNIPASVSEVLFNLSQYADETGFCHHR